MKDSHIGDLNNLVADENGEATVDIKFEHSPRPSLFEGETNILRRTLVIHAGSQKQICLSKIKNCLKRTVWFMR